MTRVRVRYDIGLEYLITGGLPCSRIKQPSRLVRQHLQWGSERVQVISLGVVGAEIVSGDIGLTDCPRVVPFKCEGTCFASSTEEPRVKIARIEK